MVIIRCLTTLYSYHIKVTSSMTRKFYVMTARCCMLINSSIISALH